MIVIIIIIIKIYHEFRFRLLYWSDWGAKPYIKRATLDGIKMETVVDSGLGWPNGLCLDYAESRVYWADAKVDR